MTSDFRPEVEIWPFCACVMYPAIIRAYWNSLFIVNVIWMGQMPRSTERIVYSYMVICRAIKFETSLKYA